jgi:hypothetical protein
MSSFKKLKSSDVSLISHTANKQWGLSSDSPYITVYRGTKSTGSFDIITDSVTEGEYDRLVYNQINHLFYQSYSGSLLNTASLANSLYYESASQQRPTKYYFNYNEDAALIKNFPSASEENIKVFSIDQSIFGSQILPYNFIISSSAYLIADDGRGNLYDVNPAFEIDDYVLEFYVDNNYFTDVIPDSVFIGNIYYSQGLAIITNQNYQSMFTSSYSASFKNEHIVYENEIRCVAKENEFNLSYNPSLSSDESGSLYGFATSSSFSPYSTGIGLYNDNNQLLAVAKFSKPLLMSPDTDMTFVVKYDL